MLRGSEGEECEQEMGESKITTVAFSWCKLTQTLRLSTSQCDYATFLFSSWILLKKGEKKETHNGRLKAVHKSYVMSSVFINLSEE